ncbi:MAG: class II fructose-bisphosphate aldolase [Bacillota bacterium]
MGLINTVHLLQNASSKGSAIGAFNIFDKISLAAVLMAAEEEKSPVIIQTSEKTVRYYGAKNLFSLIENEIEAVTVPVSLHLDHGKDAALIRECVEAGWTSVMYDGSEYPFAENVARTKEIVLFAHEKNISVEGELGKIAGVEDDLDIEEEASALADPDEVVKFRELTGVDFLAPAIGTMHGIYKVANPKIDLERLQTIRSMVSIPLVVHGCSGLSEEILVELIRRGSAKMNISTEIKNNFLALFKKEIETNHKEPLVIFKNVTEQLAEVVKVYIRLFNISGASL